MESAFNKHMSANYSPGWLSCLDESMNEWMNKFSPGFMHVPRKPHPFGNEYHTICDGDEGGGNPILWRLEIQEGKDRPAHLGKRKYEEFGATVGTMMRMCEPIFGSAKIVTMDSGFCVAKGITKLAENGVFGQALVKKRKYWPRYVPGDMIDSHMSTKAVGESSSFKQVLEGRDFFVHCTKDRDYVTKIMSCHGTLTPVPTHKTLRRINGESEPRRFCYVEPLSRHNKAKHWVDDHNNRRHGVVSLSDGWRTKWWPHRQFTFILGVTEVNSIHTMARACKQPAESQLQFRRELARLLITTEINNEGRRVREVEQHVTRSHLRVKECHVYLTKPPYALGWLGAEWKRSKAKYAKQKCYTCNFLCRTYCSCDPSKVMCIGCYRSHTNAL